jgi:hypothetical protein
MPRRSIAAARPALNARSASLNNGPATYNRMLEPFSRAATLRPHHATARTRNRVLFTAGLLRAPGTGCRAGGQTPRLPSMVSRMMSAWPACRAVSSIMCSATHRRLRSAICCQAHGASRSTLPRICRDAAICSR